MTAMDCQRMASDKGLWYLENLVCPIDRTGLRFDGERLRSKNGRCYPIVDGVPVLLVSSGKQTIGLANASIERAQGRSDVIDQRARELYLESLGLNDEEKAEVARLWKGKLTAIDPVVAMIIGATCGNAYKDLTKKLSLTEYPIPSIRLTSASTGDALLDIGCNWGRWSIAAAKKGFSAVGIDPSLGAIMAARRIADELKPDIKYLVADARFLPFRNERFRAVYSYSVLQHFAKEDVRRTLLEVSRVLEPGAVAKIQMANKLAFAAFNSKQAGNRTSPKNLRFAIGRSVGVLSGHRQHADLRGLLLRTWLAMVGFPLHRAEIQACAYCLGGVETIERCYCADAIDG